MIVPNAVRKRPTRELSTGIASPTEYLLCPRCAGDLIEENTGLRCTACGSRYEVRDGIPVVLGEVTDETRRRYLENYERIAEVDLQTPIESLRNPRHERLLSFIGDVRGSRVLDIGSSNALYLRQLNADFKVAFDIALPYLRAIHPAHDLGVVCGDAERLPLRPGFFDVIILSDVLEHVLDPQAVVGAVERISQPGTRVIVEVPWEENLSSYQGDQQWEFTHLRSFDLFGFSTLWSRFRIVRMRSTLPALDFPLFLHGRRKVPLGLLNRLRILYHHRDHYAEADLEWRRRRLGRLPRHDAFLTALSRPLVQQFELTPFPPEAVEGTADRWLDRLIEGCLRNIYRH